MSGWGKRAVSSPGDGHGAELCVLRRTFVAALLWLLAAWSADGHWHARVGHRRNRRISATPAGRACQSICKSHSYRRATTGSTFVARRAGR